MTANRLEYLFKRHLEETATPEEKTELLNLIQQEEHNEQLNKLVDQALMEDFHEHDLDKDTAHSILASIIQVDQQGHKEKEEVPVVRMRKPVSFKRIAYIAAAVIVSLFVGGMYLWNRPTNQVIDVSRKKMDAAPGQDKAILTLADGAQIILDSAGKRVFDQGGVAVSQHHGELRYNTTHKVTTAVTNMLTTPKGGQFRVTLPDGTNVWLNAASTLKYPVAFTGHTRQVEFSGEGYFEVAPVRLRSGSKMPFIVKVGNTVVNVLGTHFNIMAYPDEELVKTTLLEGSVQVGNRESGIGNRESGIVKLVPGQQAQIKNDISDNGNITVIDQVNVEEVIAWKNGQFMFNGTDLPALLRQFSRWYNIDVVYKGQRKNYAFTGTMPRSSHLSSVLKLLKVNDIPYTLENNQLIVQP